jgi:hypothetical protein
MINALLLSKNHIVPLQNIINDFDSQAYKNDVIAYLHAAGIFKYLYENFGIEKMQKLWTKGFDDFEQIYSFPVEQLEKEWLEYIKNIPVPQNIDEKTLLRDGCG